MHYSPVIGRFLVKAIYHEAKRRKVPMTMLTDTLLTEGLRDTEGWKEAESKRVREEPQPTPTKTA